MTRVRTVAWRGRVQAAGLWFPAHHQARVLATWCDGDTVRAVASGWMLRFAQPRSLIVSTAPGTVLVDVERRLSACPLEDDELIGQAGHLVWVRGGVAVDEGPGEPVDLGAWVAVEVEVAEVRALGAPPSLVVRERSVPKDLREVFADTVPERGSGGGGLGGGGVGSAMAQAGLHAAVTAVGWMRKLGLSRGPQAGEGGTAMAPHSPGVLERLDGWLSQTLVRAGLGQVLGQKWGRYFNELLDKLDSDDLKAALADAIPLGGGAGGLNERLPGMWGGIQGAGGRITAAGSGYGSSIPLSDTFTATLRQRYERLAARLEAAERFDEAAYVWAELLVQPLRAINLLETHERWAKAAEIAELKQVKPATVVRLHFMAGNLEHAVHIAQRYGVFEQAVAALEARQSPWAAGLRAMWAASAAKAGDWSTAVHAMGDADTDEMHGWAEHAIALGGVPAAKMVVWQVARRPAALDQRSAQITALLRDPRDEVRTALATQLVQHERSDSLDAIGRATLRAMRGSPVRRHTPHAAALAKLEGHLDDALSDDKPTTKATVSPELTPACRPWLQVFDPQDRGGAAVAAAAWMEGRLWVALGEAGLVWMKADGTRLRHWKEPTHDVVIDTRGGRVLAITERGDILRVDRIDAATGARTPWAQVHLHRYLPTCDDVWFVVQDGRLAAIDTVADAWRRTWSVPLEGWLIDVAQGDASLAVLVRSHGDLERWRYELPSYTLRARKMISGPGADTGLDPEDEARVWWSIRADGRAEGWTCGETWKRVVGDPTALIDHDGSPFQLLSWGTVTAVVFADRVVVVDRDVQDARLDVRLQDACRVFVHASGDHLVMADDLGRVVVMDVRDGALLADVRVRL